MDRARHKNIHSQGHTELDEPETDPGPNYKNLIR